jgi:hypothetical protein
MWTGFAADGDITKFGLAEWVEEANGEAAFDNAD